MIPSSRQRVGSGASRTSQPRRKSSQAKQHLRTNSFESQRNNTRGSNSNFGTTEDAMEVDDEPLFSREAAESALYPLRQTADRVGNQVEQFAEKLDEFRQQTLRRKTEEGSIDATLALIHDFREIAQDTLKKLRKTHGAEHKRKLQLAWSRSNQQVDSSRYGSQSDDPNDENISSTAVTTLQDLEGWQNEYNTWDLLYNLISCRSTNSTSQGYTESELQESRFGADGDTFDELLSQDALFREKFIIVKWLESCSEQTGEDLDIIEEEISKNSGQGQGLWSQSWIDTRERLKGHKRLRLWDKPMDSTVQDITSSTEEDLLVTQLDMDAVTRMKRSLEQPDLVFEKSFWTMCWEMLRRGVPMAELRAYCEEHHEHARAAIMGVYGTLDDTRSSQLDINVRFRWRKACGEAAKHGGLNHYERAVLGLLSGDLTSVEKVALTWEDHLHAHYNACLLQKYNEMVVERFSDRLPPKDLYKFGSPDFSMTNRNLSSDPQEILDTLNEEGFGPTSKDPLKILQAGIIMSGLENIFVQLGLDLSHATAKNENKSISQLISLKPLESFPAQNGTNLLLKDNNSLRVFAHVLILLSHTGSFFSSNPEREAAENIVLAYMTFLLEAGKMDLIPLYGSYLHPQRKESAMARVLPSITNASQRLEYVKLMKLVNMDVTEICTIQYELALEYSGLLDQEKRDDVKGFKILEPVRKQDERSSMWPGKRVITVDERPLSQEHEVVIQSLEWFLLLDGYWFQTFAALTDVAKRFLMYGHVEAASELLQRMPPRQISLAKTPPIIGKRVDISDFEMDVWSTPGSPEAPLSPPGLVQSNMSTSFGLIHSGDPAKVDPEDLPNLQQAMKIESTTYYEIGQLMNIIENLWNWRQIEDWRFGMVDDSELQQARQETQQVLDSLKQGVSSIEPGFLTTPSLGTGPSESARAESFRDLEIKQLRFIRETYLPEIILGYHSALVCGGFLQSRTRELDALEIANLVANDDELSRCFQATERMRELVTALALGSKALLKLNEAKDGTKTKTKTMGRQGERVLTIWNITG